MKYTGILSKTIARRRLGGLAGEDAYNVEDKRIDDEMRSKLPELFKAHQVIDGDWMGLALALAKAHVPGFRLSRPAGPKTKWGLVEKAEFRLAVDIIIGTSNLSVVEAIKQVCRLDAWKEKTSKPSIEALEQHYYHADWEFVQVVKDARAWTTHLEVDRL